MPRAIPKFNFHLASPRMRFVGLLLALGFFAVAPLVGQLTRRVVRGLKIPQYYEAPLVGRSQTNQLKGMFMAATAQHLSNELFFNTQVRIEHYEFDGRTNMVARAPECLLDQDTQVAWSTGRLEIVGLNGALFVEGNQGFELLMTNSTLTISNRVRTVLRQGLLKTTRP